MQSLLCLVYCRNDHVSHSPCCCCCTRSAARRYPWPTLAFCSRFAAPLFTRCIREEERSRASSFESGSFFPKAERRLVSNLEHCPFESSFVQCVTLQLECLRPVNLACSTLLVLAFSFPFFLCYPLHSVAILFILLHTNSSFCVCVCVQVRHHSQWPYLHIRLCWSVCWLVSHQVLSVHAVWLNPLGLFLAVVFPCQLNAKTH